MRKKLALILLLTSVCFGDVHTSHQVPETDNTIDLGSITKWWRNVWSKVLIIGSDPPATSGSAGAAGTVTYDADYIYVCIAADTWKRAALSAFGITDVLLLDDGASKLLLDDGASNLLIRP